MKKIVSMLGLFFVVGLLYVVLPAGEGFASSKESDRVLVQFDGRELIESVAIEEVELLDGVEVLQPDFIRHVAIETATGVADSCGV